MSHSSGNTPRPARTAMQSEVMPLHVPVGSSLNPSAEIKQEEPDAEPSTNAFQFTPIPIPTPTVAPKASTPILSTTPVSNPTFTPVTTTSTPIAISTSTTSTTRKPGRGRLVKDRKPIENPPTEIVNYPCHEGAQLSDFNRQKLQEYDVYPTDGISKYTRSIPFKGTKEHFLRKTGRSRFDVFEYRFTAPNTKGESKQWWVMWDYYNGLVRVHDFFDCCRPGKTEPGNAVKEKINPGLQSICHNITGGNLHAQGYWIPFLAAKALAAKFCFRIRFALTIIFGDDFPAICLPETSPDFGKYQIPPAIIQSCRLVSEQQHALEAQRAPSTSTSPAIPLARRSPEKLKCQRISVTPERTAANRYFDPVRGGYTNGSSNSSSSQIKSRYNTTRTKTMTKKVAKVYKPTSSVTSLETSPRLPLMGSFSPIPSSRARRLPALEARPPGNGKMGVHPLVESSYLVKVDDDMVDVSADRPYPAARKHSLSPPASGRQKKSTAKRLSPSRAASPSLEPVSNPPAVVDPDQETHGEPVRKRAKVAPSEPRVYTNPYMNKITFCVGTFTNPQRASRDPSIPEPANPYTRRRYDELVATQVEESPEDLLAVEAASQLMELQRRDYDRDFAQRVGMVNPSLKRRRSN